MDEDSKDEYQIAATGAGTFDIQEFFYLTVQLR